MKTRIIATAVLMLSIAFGTTANAAPQARPSQGQPPTEHVRQGDGDHHGPSHHDRDHRAGHRKAKAYMHHGRRGNCHHHHNGGGHDQHGR